jgi:hypothetical protein
MKIRNLLAVVAVSASFVGAAQAQTKHVYITGSTAFRGAVFWTLATNMFDSAPSIVSTKCSALTPAPGDPSTGSFMMFTGNIGAVPYIIKCSWSGSEAGIADLVTNNATGKELFPVDGTAGVTNQSTTAPTDSEFASLAFSDTDQSVSLNKTPALTGAQVGIIPFVFLKNAQTTNASLYPPTAEWSRLTNVTTIQVRQLLFGGAPMGYLTGNPADTNWCYIAGRDNLSGTFDNTMQPSITGFGLVNNPSQIEINTNAGGAAIIQGGVLLSGKGKGVEGQNSGGTLATTMAYCGSGTNDDPIADGNGLTTSGWYAIAYIGLPDADIALNKNGFTLPPFCAPASLLTFNGVAESTTAIEQGEYSFWGNEWLYKSANNLGDGGPIYTKLVANIPAACDDVYYIKTTSMQCQKATSSSDPIHF